MIVGGDLNTVLFPLGNRRTGGGGLYIELEMPAFQPFFILRDWEISGDGRDFTYFSHGHQSWSRIDYVFTSERLSLKFISGDMRSIFISDQASVIVTLSDVYPRGSDFIWRFPAYMIKNQTFRDLLKEWWLEYIDLNVTQESDPSFIWNAVKMVLRGRIKSYVATCNDK